MDVLIIPENCATCEVVRQIQPLMHRIELLTEENRQLSKTLFTLTRKLSALYHLSQELRRNIE